MSAMTPEEIAKGLAENASAPGGPARNAHAEALVAAAEATGDRALFRRTLDNLIGAYLFSAESPKMLVPFARLLQEYDNDPGAFGSWEVHTLFWQFKWVANALTNSPDISLESATGWLDEMERRYRLAGHSERPVREAEMWLADSTGDDARAERAHRAWLKAERDEMSDCHACEINGQGQYALLRGDDTRALDVWAPVLERQRTCAEEPHRVMARALLPLLRLGRLDEARAHHLHGYRLSRGNESLLPAIGRHMEFCALTGNESRGLEILAEHTAQLRPLANANSQLAFHGGVLVLLRRLTELGHGTMPAPAYDGGRRTVAELYEFLHAESLAIARRFDARNGTTRVSERFAARIARAPLTDLLPLGVRSPALPRPATGAAAPAPPAPGREAATAGETGRAGAAAREEFADLLAAAREARAQLRPDARELWARVSARAAARPDTAGDTVDPLLAADLLEHRAVEAALAGEDTAREQFVRVRDAYLAAGAAGRAVLAECRIAMAAAQVGAGPAEVRALLDDAARSARALAQDDPYRARRIAHTELTRLRMEAYLRRDEGSAADAELAGELAAFARSLAGPAGEGAADVLAEAEEQLARYALEQGDTGRAEALLASAASRGPAAGRPWLAVEPLTLRADVLGAMGRVAEAEESARAAVEHAERTGPETQGSARLTLANVLLHTGASAEALVHALDAAHWFDRAGLAVEGARARLLLARAYAREDRNAEAAEVLQSALPDVLEQGPEAAVGAREFLGDLLGGLGDHRAAAEQYLLAADIAKDWPDPRPQASLAHSAAEALSSAGLPEESVAAYERALELHSRHGGQPVAEVRILRSLVWLGLRDGVTEEGLAEARGRMEAAERVLWAALEPAPGDPRLRAELAQTWHQLAQVLDRRVTDLAEADDGDADEVRQLREEEVRLWGRAAGVYRELGADHWQERLQCVNNAAWTEHELERRGAAEARVEALVAEVRSLPADAVPDWVPRRAERILEALRD
ncbi:tetratricopeptide repeat protein [Streptomyces sp. NPDC012888]|uniref:tetratricopeptide repeat protein n=1 Tax=Streptomyces sp. NPDC012888 TaxID=3364855 RepID=UPI003699B09A